MGEAAPLFWVGSTVVGDDKGPNKILCYRILPGEEEEGAEALLQASAGAGGVLHELEWRGGV